MNPATILPRSGMPCHLTSPPCTQRGVAWTGSSRCSRVELIGVLGGKRPRPPSDSSSCFTSRPIPPVPTSAHDCNRVHCSSGRHLPWC
jgi:hypothetical protein